MTDQSSIISLRRKLEKEAWEGSLRRKLEKEAWEIKSLGEIATEVISGKGIEGSQLGTGDYPAIRNGNIGGKLKQKFEECIIFVNKDLIKNPVFCEHGDVLITTRNNIRENVGKATVYLGKEKPIVGNNIFIIKHNQNGRFLSYILGSRYVRKQIEKEARMGTLAQLHKYCLTHIKIPLPPRHIQDQISEYLDKWTELEIQLEQKLKEELEQRKKQYYYYKESLLNSEMNKWDIISLDKVATEIISGKEITKEQLGTGDYPAIKFISSKANHSLINCSDFVNIELMKTKVFCEYGDILVVRSNGIKANVGRSVVYLGNERPVIGQGVWLIKHKQSGKFLSYVLGTEHAKRQIQKIIGGGVVTNINRSCFNHIKIPLPSIEKQNQIVELLDKFHTIAESFKDGLPALIEKHRKQYIYYKEQILNPEVAA